MRIRSRLLILVLSILVPAALVAALGIAYVYTEAQDANRQSMRETAHALALVVDKEIAKREAILHALAASPALDRNDFRTFYQQAKGIASTWDTAIILSDTSGQQFLNTRKPLGMKGLPVTVFPELRKRYGKEATVVSNLYLAPVGKSDSFAVEMPVKRGDRILYYISMGSFASQLQSVFEEQQLPAEWLGTIIDRNGRVVARSREPQKYVGKQAPGSFGETFRARPEGFYDGVTLDGVPVHAFYSFAPNSGWMFIVSVPKSLLQRSAVQAAAWMGGILLLLLGFAVLAAFAVARNTARPIEALRLASRRLGRGERISAERSGIVEMDAVSVAMARASEEIASARAELEERVAQAVAAAERSQRALLQGQKLEALGRLTGGIAHDFNNVLQTLTTGLEVAHFSTQEPKARSAIEASQRAVRRATELIGRLMAFGRVQDVRLETIDPQRQIAAITPMLKSALRTDIDFRLDIADRLWPVTLDPLQFELALLNLTMNARDAMPKGGALKLAARNDMLAEASDDLAAGDYVRISVIDSGEGMSQEVLARAFDPFFTTKSVGKGSGLGLPQAYGFAKQAGGGLTLRSRPGEGTVAELYLPRADSAAGTPPSGNGAAQRTAAGEAVLFVEDDPLIRDVVAPALEASGFRVSVARDGEEALALLETGKRFDLVFSDIVMSGKISGIDLAEIIRARFPRTGLVLATGYSESRVPGIRSLAKPYDMVELTQALHQELRAMSERNQS